MVLLGLAGVDCFWRGLERSLEAHASTNSVHCRGNSYPKIFDLRSEIKRSMLLLWDAPRYGMREDYEEREDQTELPEVGHCTEISFRCQAGGQSVACELVDEGPDRMAPGRSWRFLYRITALGRLAFGTPMPLRRRSEGIAQLARSRPDRIIETTSSGSGDANHLAT
jgi:hypothetical protein